MIFTGDNVAYNKTLEAAVDISGHKRIRVLFNLDESMLGYTVAKDFELSNLDKGDSENSEE